MFDWREIGKAAELASGQWEEDVEVIVNNLVFEHVLKFYNLDDLDKLTKTQIEEIQKFVDNIHEYKIMKLGFYNLLNRYDEVVKVSPN